jgi:hypothetical protein
MKRGLIVAEIVLLSGLGSMPAQAGCKTTKGTYQQGTVVSVKRHQPETYYYGSPTDAPLQANEYDYDVGVRVDCSVYVGRYKSAIPYIPSSFVPNHPVDVLQHKHVLYVRMPEIGRKVKMGIVGHKPVKDDSCRLKG